MLRSPRLALIVFGLLAGVVLAADDGFAPLFDGKTLQGWTHVNSGQGNWVVQDGLLVTKGQGGGWLSTEKTYANFVLKLEYRLKPGGNSGVFLRAPHTGDPAYSGMEIQILDDDDEQYKSLQPFQYAGSLYGVVAAKRGHTKPAGQWNAMEITADGPKITIKLNGATVVEANVKEHPDAVAQHPGLERTEGYIGLQSHSEPVEFRNIQVKVLK
jgi:Domain of Unknown Function (DUF1080)